MAPTLSTSFDFERIAVDTVALDDAQRIENQAARYNLPHLGKFLLEIAQQYSSPDEAYGRRYQRDAIEARALKIVSPFTGEPAFSSCSIAVMRSVFYRFHEGAADYYVASATIGLGYPLSALLLPGENVLLSWEHRERNTLLPKLERLATLVRRNSQPESSRSEVSPVVLMGHENFAHHMWNELPALERLIIEPRSGPPPEVVVTRETLGPLEAIFPELSGWVIRRPKGQRRYSGSEAGKLYVNLGSYRVSASMRARIVRHAMDRATAETVLLIERLRTLSAPVFWLSVRVDKPTFSNQRDVMVAVAARLLEAYPRCSILFDGFSLPEDWKVAHRSVLDYYNSTVANVRQEIDSTIAQLAAARVPTTSQLVVNIGGKTLLDSIATAQHADVYFCHRGTTQHKIGWTANKPGIIHGPRKVLIGDQAELHALRVEHGTYPSVLDPTLVRDECKDRQTNYTAVDCARVADFVLRYFAECLSGTRARSAG